MSTLTHRWVDIGAVADIPKRGARLIKAAGGCIAVFRTGDDRVFALEDRCPHKGGPLSQGIVHGHKVSCPLHDAVISLETGLVEGPDDGQATTIKARIEDGRILLDRHGVLALAAPQEAAAEAAEVAA